MKNTNHKKIIITLLSIIFFFSTISVFAADLVTQNCDKKTCIDSVTKKTCCLLYVPLEPNAFPGVETSSGNLSVYLGQIFNFGIAIAVALALIMIIWGGIMYMTTDSWEGKSDGKDKITSALWGLGLALVSWLLLYTINPNLVQFNSTNNTLLSTPSSQTTTK